VVSYAAMAVAGFTIGLLFQVLGLVPAHHPVVALTSAPTLNYTSVLNVIFLAIMALLGWQFLRTNGLAMLRMMEAPPVTPADAASHQHHETH
jgi:uncharacterized protein